MPFIAYRDLDERKLVLPQLIEEREDVICPSCEEAMHLVSAHARGSAQIPNHFRHYVERGCTGESNEHRHAKYTAVQLLHERLPELLDPSINYEIKWEERLHQDDEGDTGAQIDVLARFTPPAPRWGRGLAIEVQHKNKAKQIHGYTREVLGKEISILWVSSERFLRPITQLLDGFDELILGTHPDLERVTQHPQAQLDASSWDRYPLIERSPLYHLERIEYTSPELDARDHLDPLRVELRAANRDRGKGFRKMISKYVKDWQSKLNTEPGSSHLREIQRRLPGKRKSGMRVKLPPGYWRMIELDRFGLITWSLYYGKGPGNQHEQEVIIIDAEERRDPADDPIKWGGFEGIEWEVTEALPPGLTECDYPRCDNTAQYKFVTSRDGVEVPFTRCERHMYITKFWLVHRAGQMRYNQ